MPDRAGRSGMGNTRVVLADDHAVVRTGLRGELCRMAGFEGMGEAGSGRELLATLPAARGAGESRLASRLIQNRFWQ